MRRLRYVPEGGGLVAVTCRTLHNRFLLRPGRKVNDIIVGVLARAQKACPIRICAYIFLSGHFYLLLDVDDARQLSRFMCFLSSNLAKEIGRLVGWREKFFGHRYQSTPISSEEGAQVERLRDLLSHGVKEGLCEKVTDWPGVHCVQALMDGATVEGHWYDRTKEYAARRRKKDFDPMEFATLEVVELSPLPCWKHLPVETQRKLVAALVAGIEQEAAAERERTGSQVLGVSAILGQHPFDRPARPKKSPAPLFHAASKRTRDELYAAYAWFVDAYRQASEKLRSGNRNVAFPAGSFPPALPFVAG